MTLPVDCLVSVDVSVKQRISIPADIHCPFSVVSTIRLTMCFLCKVCIAVPKFYLITMESSKRWKAELPCAAVSEYLAQGCSSLSDIKPCSCGLTVEYSVTEIMEQNTIGEGGVLRTSGTVNAHFVGNVV